jgi:hypothetical protein
MRCAICEREIREDGYMVGISGLPGVFDRIDCALEAERRILRAERDADAPLERSLDEDLVLEAAVLRQLLRHRA